MTTSVLLRRVLQELPHCSVDLDRIRGCGWWHRPFTEAELDVPPDGERIRATIDAAAIGLVLQAVSVAAESAEP